MCRPLPSCNIGYARFKALRLKGCFGDLSPGRIEPPKKWEQDWEQFTYDMRQLAERYTPAE